MLAIGRPTRAQLVLLELALACVAGAIAAGTGWRVLCAAAGVLLAAAAVVPVRRRWLYQLALSWLHLLRRRAAVRGPGLQSMLDGYRVITVPASGQSPAFAVVRSGGMWSLPLGLAPDGSGNGDAPVPLAPLLRVEDVPMATVRLLTVQRPALATAGRPGPVPPPRPAARYLVVTMDTALAADAIAARGGTDAAFHQILRRAALRAEQSLAAVGVAVQRLNEGAVTELFTSCLGPAADGGAGRRSALRASVETWTDVRVAGTWSVCFVVAGVGNATDAANRLAAAARTPVAVTSVLLHQPGRRAEPETTLVLRLSGPGARADRGALAALAERARAAGVVLQRMDGEQGRLLRATTPVGIAATSV